MNNDIKDIMSSRRVEDILVLSSLNRWQTRNKLFDETVAAHSYMVTMLSIDIARQVELMHPQMKASFNVEVMMKMGLIHDYAESVLNDVSYIAKSKYGMKQPCDEAETLIMRDRVPSFSDLYELYEKQDTIEALAVKLADHMCVYIFAERELHSGNKYFLDILEQSEELINNKFDKLIERIEND